MPIAKRSVELIRGRMQSQRAVILRERQVLLGIEVADQILALAWLKISRAVIKEALHWREGHLG